MKRVDGTMVCVLAAALCGSAASAGERCEQLTQIGGAKVWKTKQGALVFEAGLAIDADGAPNAYHPNDTGLDHLANAGKPGNWWGVVTDDGTAKGTPVIQGPTDPFPGFFVSATALEDPERSRSDPRRYVDSATVPYVVLPPTAMAPKLPGGPRLGDFAQVKNLANGITVWAIVADIGPATKLGEGSIALATALGIKSNPKAGGAARGVRFIIHPGSGNRRPRTADDLARQGERLSASSPDGCE